MKLNRTQIAAVRRQTGFRPVPAEAAAETGLAGAFGDQTFYVDEDGLYVFEAVAPASGNVEPLLGIRIARVERPDARDPDASADDASADDDAGDQILLQAVTPHPAGLRADLPA